MSNENVKGIQACAISYNVYDYYGMHVHDQQINRNICPAQ